jgi:orotate phosphoribosyltransferase
MSKQPPLPDHQLDSGEVLALYERTGGLRRGHFELTSGLHSDVYLQSAVVLQWPAVAAALGTALAAPWRDRVDVVVGPAMGGVVIGHEVARSLGTRMVFTERAGGAIAMRRSFEVGVGERALVVENVVTTGGSAIEVAELLSGAGASVVGLATIIDRLPAGTELPLAYARLASVEAGVWSSEECPICGAGREAESPGGHGLVDRSK